MALKNVLGHFHTNFFNLTSSRLYNAGHLLAIQSDKRISLQSLVRWDILQSDQWTFNCETWYAGYLMHWPMKVKASGFHKSKCCHNSVNWIKRFVFRADHMVWISVSVFKITEYCITLLGICLLMQRRKKVITLTTFAKDCFVGQN